MPLYQPGEVYDLNRRPIYPGDVIRSFHFRGARGKRYWLYHVAVWNADEKTMELVPASELEPQRRGRGGRVWLTPEHGAEVEIISGHGPGQVLDYEDRPRRAAPAAPWSVLYEAHGAIYRLGPFATQREAEQAAEAAHFAGEFNIVEQHAYLVSPEHAMIELSLDDLIPKVPK